MYRVNNIYTCIQGEGVLTGVPMTLLRLHGCGVGCPWCDTKETWNVSAAHKVDGIDATLGANENWCEASASELAAFIAHNHAGPQWVLVTGGEPADQDLEGLVNALHDAHLKVALETSGTANGHLWANFDWVCVSPKINMPGGKQILPAAIESADEIKMVVGKRADIDTLEGLLERCRTKPNVTICLQPVSQSPKATELCIETVQQKGWRLSAQLHKYLALP